MGGTREVDRHKPSRSLAVVLAVGVVIAAAAVASGCGDDREVSSDTESSEIVLNVGDVRMRIRPMSDEERADEYEAFMSANPSNPDLLRECVDEAYWASGFGGHAPVSAYGTGDGIMVVIDQNASGRPNPVYALLGVTTKHVESVSLGAEAVPFVQDGRWVLMQPPRSATGSAADLQVKTADALLPVSTRSYC